MSMESMDMPVGADDRLIQFDGHWSEFLKIAVVNLLLSIVTLGIYRYWAKTKVRRYLWSRTTVLGERLEYTGTGLQLFLGAIIAVVVLILPIVILSQIAQALLLSGSGGLAALIYLLMIVGVFYLMGVGLYRVQRYLLSHTTWRGIRGGMVSGGWSYGLSYLWRNLVTSITLNFAAPWSTTRLWNEMWNDSRFGSLEFHANAPARPLFARFAVSFVLALVLIGAVMAANWSVLEALGQLQEGGLGKPELAKALLSFYGLVILMSIGVGLIMLSYYALFWRHVVGHTSLDTLSFSFSATTADWLRFFLGNIGLVIITLGFGLIMMPYRVYSFMVRNLHAEGALAPAAIEQSRLAMPSQGEGIADAFDLSPI